MPSAQNVYRQCHDDAMLRWHDLSQESQNKTHIRALNDSSCTAHLGVHPCAHAACKALQRPLRKR